MANTIKLAEIDPCLDKMNHYYEFKSKALGRTINNSEKENYIFSGYKDLKSIKKIDFNNAKDYMKHVESYHDAMLMFIYQNGIESKNISDETRLNRMKIFTFFVIGLKESFIDEFKKHKKSKQITSIVNSFSNYIHNEKDPSLADLVLTLIPSSFISLSSYESTKNIIQNENPNQLNKLLSLIKTNEMSFISKENHRLSMISQDRYYSDSAEKIEEVYDKNEVKGDLTFKGKTFYVVGNVDSINSSIQDQPAVHFKTDSENPFQMPTAFFKDYEAKIEKIADIEKGETLKLLCKGGGEVAGSPILSECEFVDDRIKSIIESSKNTDSLSGNYDAENLYLSAKLLASLLPSKSACFNNDIDKCKKELINLPNDKIRSLAEKSYGLSSAKVKTALHRKIEEINNDIIKSKENSDDVNKYIDIKRECIDPLLLSLF